jgi:hypothetical protein
MKRPFAAVAGGTAGTAVLTLLLLLFEVETRSQIGMFEVVARFVGVPGNATVGFVLFVFAGVFVWPLLLVGVEEWIPGDDPGLKGMAFGVVLWVAFVLLGRGTMGGPLLLAFGGLTLLAHLAYGFVSGAIYASLTGTTPTRGGSAEQRDIGS